MRIAPVSTYDEVMLVWGQLGIPVRYVAIAAPGPDPSRNRISGDRPQAALAEVEAGHSQEQWFALSDAEREALRRTALASSAALVVKDRPPGWSSQLQGELYRIVRPYTLSTATSLSLAAGAAVVTRHPSARGGEVVRIDNPELKQTSWHVPGTAYTITCEWEGGHWYAMLNDEGALVDQLASQLDALSAVSIYGPSNIARAVSEGARASASALSAAGTGALTATVSVLEEGANQVGAALEEARKTATEANATLQQVLRTGRDAAGAWGSFFGWLGDNPAMLAGFLALGAVSVIAITGATGVAVAAGAGAYAAGPGGLRPLFASLARRP